MRGILLANHAGYATRNVVRVSAVCACYMLDFDNRSDAIFAAKFAAIIWLIYNEYLYNFYCLKKEVWRNIILFYTRAHTNK